MAYQWLISQAEEKRAALVAWGWGDAGMKRTVDLICNDWILEVEGSKQEGVLQLDPIIAEAQLLREAIVQM